MDLQTVSVTILGAGIAGLAAARALALRGAKVTVMEQAAEIAEVGAGLQVSPNGAAVLTALGLRPALEAASLRSQAVELRDGLSGDLVTRLDLARGVGAAQGYHLIHRADLIALLLDGARAAGAELRLLQKVKSVDLSGDAPVICTGTGALEGADLLIGADGLHSPTHAALNGASTPRFTQQIAWRATIACDADAAPLAEIHMGPGRHLVSYPLRGGRLRNIVAVEQRRAWVEEGWSLRDDPMELRLAFAGFNPRVRGWLEQIEDVWLWGLFRHPVAEIWQKALPRGGVAILGDAAHPTLPFLAQGANMALEDAWVLADCLAAAADLGAGLAQYQIARRARCARIVAAANRNARAYHLSGPIRNVAHLGLKLGGKIAPDLALSRFDWLYGHDVTA